jgi:hypothetical protein
LDSRLLGFLDSRVLGLWAMDFSCFRSFYFHKQITLGRIPFYFYRFWTVEQLWGWADNGMGEEGF